MRSVPLLVAYASGLVALLATKRRLATESLFVGIGWMKPYRADYNATAICYAQIPFGRGVVVPAGSGLLGNAPSVQAEPLGIPRRTMVLERIDRLDRLA